MRRAGQLTLTLLSALACVGGMASEASVAGELSVWLEREKSSSKSKEKGFKFEEVDRQKYGQLKVLEAARIQAQLAMLQPKAKQRITRPEDLMEFYLKM